MSFFVIGLHSANSYELFKICNRIEVRDDSLGFPHDNSITSKNSRSSIAIRWQTPSLAAFLTSAPWRRCRNAGGSFTGRPVLKSVLPKQGQFGHDNCTIPHYIHRIRTTRQQHKRQLPGLTRLSPPYFERYFTYPPHTSGPYTITTLINIGLEFPHM